MFNTHYRDREEEEGNKTFMVLELYSYMIQWKERKRKEMNERKIGFSNMQASF